MEGVSYGTDMAWSRSIDEQRGCKKFLALEGGLSA